MVREFFFLLLPFASNSLYQKIFYRFRSRKYVEISEMANSNAEMSLLKKIHFDETFSKSSVGISRFIVTTYRIMEPIDAKFYLRKRYLVMLLTFFGMALSHMMKANLSIVLTDIAYPKYILKENRTIYQKPQVDWNSKQVGFIIGSVAYGQIPGMIFAGIYANKYGGAILFGCGLSALSLLACLTPAVLNASYSWLFVIIRIIEGFVAGCMESSYCEICLNWSPIEQRARYVSTIPMSYAFGVVSSNLVTGYGIHYFNWQTVFFATGGTVGILAIVWLSFVRSRPSDDEFISEVERRYLAAKIDSAGEKDAKISIPWREILTSKPVWAYVNEWFCGGWSAAFIVYCLPLYVKDVTRLDVKNVALISSIPVTFSILSEITFAYIHDRIRSCDRMENSNIHRIILSFAHLGIATSLITMALWMHFEASLILMSVIRALIGIEHVYYNVMAIDVFHRYAALIRSLGTSSIVVSYCLTPLTVGFIVTNHERSQWSLFFGLIVVFNIFSIFVFYLCGSFKLQPWASVSVGNQEKPNSS